MAKQASVCVQAGRQNSKMKSNRLLQWESGMNMQSLLLYCWHAKLSPKHHSQKICHSVKKSPSAAPRLGSSKAALDRNESLEINPWEAPSPLSLDPSPANSRALRPTPQSREQCKAPGRQLMYNW